MRPDGPSRDEYREWNSFWFLSAQESSVEAEQGEAGRVFIVRNVGLANRLTSSEAANAWLAFGTLSAYSLLGIYLSTPAGGLTAQNWDVTIPVRYGEYLSLYVENGAWDLAVTGYYLPQDV